MRGSLYVKLIMAYIIFGILSFTSIAILSSKMTYNYLIKTKSKTLYDEANLIANAYSNNYIENTTSLIEAYPQIKLVGTFLHSDVWIIDNNGKIILDSSDQNTNKLINNFNPINFANKSYIIGSFFDSFSYEVLSVLAPISANYKIYGYVLIHNPITNLNKDANDILNIIYLSSIIIFGLSLLILFIFHTQIYMPLRTITVAAKQYALGNLKYQINVANTDDEIGYLAGTLNYMSNELSKAEDYQRDFITNISHDFRSPLTSIKGFLEAILDKTIPYEMQDKYIEKVLNETSRLTKLTNGILSLNQNDTKAYLHRSDFDINNVIKKVAESFETQCIDKNITLELNFFNELSIVNADINKIEQVLYNLIDNSIKFSNKNSTIFISTTKKYEKLFISIKDTGIGIPKNNINKIFDRFYKSDLSRGKDKRGTGLGLAIVKDIILSHKETIDVISTEGIGSEFIFSLRLSHKEYIEF